jgi:hypothetical protein
MNMLDMTATFVGLLDVSQGIADREPLSFPVVFI